MINKTKKFNELKSSAYISKMVGVVTIVIFFGIFGIWSVTAPIEGAVIAAGSVVVKNNRKVIQHLEGGIIEEILVKDGDIVDAGEPLIKLDAKNIKAKRDLVLWNLREQLATRARLAAERGYAEEVTFKDKLLQSDNAELQAILERERNMFKIRVDSHEEQVSILHQRISQLENQIAGLLSQRKSTNDQIKLINEEIKTVKNLLDRGLEQMPRLLGLKRKSAELSGSLGEYQSLIAKAQDAISENRVNILNLNTERLKETANLLKETEANIADLKEKYLSLSDSVQRTVISSPQSGIVTGLRFHTAGGVIAPGTPILEIVPQDQNMLIDVKLAPNDIESVAPNQKAKIMLNAYRSREIPRIDGKVIYISPDRFQDEMTGKYYYTLHVEPDDEAINNLSKDIKLYPGMPAEVFIVTQERTFMSYLLMPFRESMDKAFRE